MRKLITATLLLVALGCFAGASVAYAGDCCKPKCKLETCKPACKPKCDPCKPVCKPACDPCKPVCKPKCKVDTCTKPCKPKCDPCKPKCDPCKPVCKPKCKVDTCTKPCKPKCDPCKPKCDPCKPVCKPKCKPCKGRWVGDYNECCPPRAPRATVCVDDCMAQRYKHPYEACWAGDGMLCDTGCCGTYMPCKIDCVTCETVCKTVEVCDPCDPCRTRVEYVYETVCKPIERPRLIPWWFNPNGDGNIYLDDIEEETEEG